jgi:hypothetical protein
LEKGFTVPYFAKALKRSRQSIKVKLLDQNLVAGIGNIYASEACSELKSLHAWRLRASPLNKWPGSGKRSASYCAKRSALAAPSNSTTRAIVRERAYSITAERPTRRTITRNV